ncbi:hypothetical protein DERP_006280 [Dermatophagoides pteronyssinus]|uniref:Uncharacterized protein n=1 Tax=Dermatophagoides pteronyssinus TaxID=6956 RepID=A0ABQ8IY39_DERPT|nr:hypothetical protein DERP_006280 [Dermatophagoides pteronyssinus]
MKKTEICPFEYILNILTKSQISNWKVINSRKKLPNFKSEIRIDPNENPNQNNPNTLVLIILPSSIIKLINQINTSSLSYA